MTSVDPAVANDFQARLQALRLRNAGLTYPAISIVIAEYHGIDRAADSWRYMCRKQGAPPRSHGRPNFPRQVTA